jgi:hypothetical protein
MAHHSTRSILYETARTPMWGWFYGVVAVLTLAFQVWWRSFQCAGLPDCAPSFAKAIVWSTIWPAYWPVFLAGVIGL